jgi:hypothetical protein
VSKTTAFSRTNAIRFGAVLTGAAAVAGAATLLFSPSGSHHAASAPRAVTQGQQASLERARSDGTVNVKPLDGFISCKARIDSDRRGETATSNHFTVGTKVEVLNPDTGKAVVVTILATDKGSDTCAGMSAATFARIQDGRTPIEQALVRPVA